MEDSRFMVSPLGFVSVLLLAVILIVFSGPRVSAAVSNDDETAAFCNIDLTTFLPLPYSNSSNMHCKPVWKTYVLQYSQTEDHVVTIVLSAVYTTGWVGMGFSKNGMMLNSSAMVGWINKEGEARIKQYHLRGFEPSEVIPNKGELPLTNVPAVVVLHGATIYLAFQLKFADHLAHQPILFGFGSRYPTKHNHLYEHDDKTTIMFDFSAGSVSAAPDNIGHMKKTHGVLGLFGWGLILPYGAIVARYLKHRDPLQYYLHIVIQFVGFIIALAAVVVGVELYHRLHANVPTHRGIGIFVLVLSVLQVHPSTDSISSSLSAYLQCQA
uniref:Putative Ferric-chelate reductase 1 n=1 Tax=Davidia involucrata TaxID=16924 RepID=A0A5B7A7X6_DAVIN